MPIENMDWEEVRHPDQDSKAVAEFVRHFPLLEPVIAQQHSIWFFTAVLDARHLGQLSPRSDQLRVPIANRVWEEDGVPDQDRKAVSRFRMQFPLLELLW